MTRYDRRDTAEITAEIAAEMPPRLPPRSRLFDSIALLDILERHRLDRECVSVASSKCEPMARLMGCEALTDRLTDWRTDLEELHPPPN